MSFRYNSDVSFEFSDPKPKGALVVDGMGIRPPLNSNLLVDKKEYRVVMCKGTRLGEWKALVVPDEGQQERNDNGT